MLTWLCTEAQKWFRRYPLTISSILLLVTVFTAALVGRWLDTPAGNQSKLETVVTVPNSNNSLRLTGNGGAVRTVAFSRDGATLAFGGGDAKIWLYALALGEKTELDAIHEVRCVAFAPYERVLAQGGSHLSGDYLRLWDLTTNQEKARVSNSWRIDAIAFSPDGKLLASGGPGGVKLWQGTTLEQSSDFQGEGQFTTSVAFAPDGLTLAAADAVGGLLLWELPGLKKYVLPSPLLPRDGSVSIAFTPDGRTLAAQPYRSPVRSWDLVSQAERPPLRTGGATRALAFAPRSGELAVGGVGERGNIIELWNWNERRLQRTLSGHKSGITSMTFSPDGKILASGSNDGTVRLWDMDTK
jgi:WD40 repeat protein